MSMIGLQTDLAAFGIKIEDLKNASASTADPAKVAALTPVSVADATDATTAAALANANKTAINAIIAALKG